MRQKGTELSTQLRRADEGTRASFSVAKKTDGLLDNH